MKTKLIKILTVLFCFFTLLSVLTACNPKVEENGNGLKGCEIDTEIFAVEQNILSCTVSNVTQIFAFYSQIEIADDAEMLVATDLQFTSVLISKMAILEEGENTYYILIRNGNKQEIYITNIYRKHLYAVVFDYSYGSEVKTEYVEEGNLVVKPENPVRKGYDFAGWDFDFNSVINEDKEIRASWTAKEYTLFFEPMGGTLETLTQTVLFGQAVGTLPQPVLSGYDFDGWCDIDGNKIYARTVWEKDDNVTLYACYVLPSENITIKLIAECEVYGEKVVSSLISNTSDYEITKSKTEENIYYITVKVGKPLQALPTAKPYDNSEYAFSSWRYNVMENGKIKKIKVSAGTVISRENFPEAFDNGEIVLYAYCYALWTQYF